MRTTRIIFAGGFLGAGKTTLLWEAAKYLTEKGLNVGLITNDQATELVDSVLLSHNGFKVAEVSGSCFCCNFNGLIGAIQSVREEIAADVIIAEPVGSCTDLSATIIQPLKQYWGRELQISPLSVLADPVRLVSILSGKTAGLHADTAYIYRKQLEESDIIVLNKSDLLSPEALNDLKTKTRKMYPAAKIIAMSALSGNGLEQWLDEVLSGNDAGQHLAEIDYDIYANGEAVLGWLNGAVHLKGQLTDWDSFTRNFLIDLSRRFDDKNYPVGHVKIISENGNQFITGNITGKGDTLSIRGSVDKSDEIKFVVNARVETTPKELNSIVKETFNESTRNKYSVDIGAWNYLQPGKPNPTHRFENVI
jgi:G3E family GTPase